MTSLLVSRFILSLIVLVVGCFFLKRIWTKQVNWIAIFEGPSEIIPVTEDDSGMSAKDKQYFRELLETDAQRDAKELIAEYPNGYALFGLSVEGEVFPAKTPAISPLTVDLSLIKMRMDDEKIYIAFPPASLGGVQSSDITASIPRRVGYKATYGRVNNTACVLEVRATRSKGVVLVIGVKEKPPK